VKKKLTLANQNTVVATLRNIGGENNKNKKNLLRHFLDFRHQPRRRRRRRFVN
jgi:hypothetical protein